MSAIIATPQVEAGGGQSALHSSINSLSTVSTTTLRYLKHIADGEMPLDATQLCEFLSFTQKGLPVDSKTLKNTKHYDVLDFHALLNYMCSSQSNALKQLEVVDLSYPLSNYFISSSHNTYLTGNQLFGYSSTEAYRNVLLRGCRCIEIDVWDGEERDFGNDQVEEKHGLRSHISKSISSRFQPHQAAQYVSGVAQAKEVSLEMPTPWISATTAMRPEPRVLHGHTMTKEVTFRAVCAAIKDTAFVASRLPIIVSLEIHTCAEQQQIMVEIMKEEWGTMLVEELKDECKILPSLSELCGKILVKVKGAPDDGPAPISRTVEKVRPTSPPDFEDQGMSNDVKRVKKKGIIQALSALGIYTQSYHFTTLSAHEAQIPTHVFSLSENKLIEVHGTQGPALFSHNKNFMMRVFPSGTRVSSSNLDPALFWRKGVQMVALNWQSWDAGMMLNEAMFGGSEGWVLKPREYQGISGKEESSSLNQAEAMSHKTMNLSIVIFAAQNLPLPINDTRPEHFHPYIKCELHVEKPEERSGGHIVGGGSREGAHKRLTKVGKGIEPDFAGEIIQFLGINGVVEELSFVRFKVQDHLIGKDGLAAWACIRLDRLQSGFRFVHLLDANGVQSSGKLLVRVSKQAL